LAERATGSTTASTMTSYHSNHSMIWLSQPRLLFSPLKGSEISLIKMLFSLCWTINSEMIVCLKEVMKFSSPKTYQKALIWVIHSDTIKVKTIWNYLNYRK
jgi:hypothetical protein